MNEDREASRRLDAAAQTRPITRLKPVVTLNLRLKGPVYVDLIGFLEDAADDLGIALEVFEVKDGPVRKMRHLKVRGDPFKVEEFRQEVERRVVDYNRRDRRR